MPLASMFSFICCFFLPAYGSPSFLLHRVVDSMIFISALTVLACKNCLKVGLILSSIKLKTFASISWIRRWRFPLHKISYFFGSCYASSSCFCGATHAIVLFVCSLFFVLNICSDSLRILSVWNLKRVFFRRLYSCLSFYLQWNSSSLSLYSLPFYDDLFLKHHSALHLSWLLNMCSRVTLLACRNYSELLFLLFFIKFPQFLLSLRSSDLVHSNIWALPPLTMEKMCLETTFMQ